MAISVPNQTTDQSDQNDMQDTITPTVGNWLIAVVSWRYYIKDGKPPLINIADAPRNVWTLLSTKTQQASNTESFSGGIMNVQVWACPAVHYAGWSYNYVTTSIQSCLGGDQGSFLVNLVEVAGMGNGYLTVDSIATFDANQIDTLTMSIPVASANSLMIAAATSNINYGSYTTTGTGWTQLSNNIATTPDIGQFAAWREGSTASSMTFGLLGAPLRDWVGVIVSIHTTGNVPTNSNSNWPAVECQFGFGYDLSTPLSAVWWTDQSKRYWALNTKRGIQYELGSAQAEPTTLTMKNDDGMFSPRTALSGISITATGTGTSTTFVCSATNASVLNATDVFRLSYSALNANTGFESGTTGWTGAGGALSTVTSPVHDGSNAGKMVPTGSAATVTVESAQQAVVPGNLYTASGWLYNNVARSVSLNVNWYDSSHVYISTSSNNSSVAATTWTYLSDSFYPPANAAYGTVVPSMFGTPPATNILFMDSVVLKPKDEFTAFQVSGITTSGGTSTIKFATADQSNGGSVFATKTGDTLSCTPIDIYTPYRILMSWGGRRHYVTSGWVERWPQIWRDPHWGTVGALTVNALSSLTSANPTPVAGEVMRRKPYAYWPLSDAVGSNFGSNVSGASLSQMVKTVTKAGAAGGQTADFGASTQGTQDDPSNTIGGVTTTLVGDPGSAWGQSFSHTGSPPAGAADLNAGRGYALVAKDSGFPAITNGVSIFFVTNLTVDDQDVIFNSTIDPTMLMVRNSDPAAGVGQGSVIKVSHDRVSSGYPRVTVWDKSTHASTSTLCNSGDQMGINWISACLVFNKTNWTMYVGGFVAGAGTCNLVDTFSGLNIGGESDQFASGHVKPGMLAHVAVYNRVLSQSEITAMENAVSSGSASETTSNRVQRKLDTMGMKTGRITDATGGVKVDAEGTDATTIADVCNQVGSYEDAYLFEDAGGVYQYRPSGRQAEQSIRATLGEDVAGGELPYLGNIETDFDPTYLYNAITIQNTAISARAFNRSIASSTFAAVDDTSATKYNLRTYNRNTRLDGDNLDRVFYLNYWLLSQYSTPKQRFQSVTLDPASNPSLWEFCLTVETGDLITVNRRPIGAPMISEDCVVLQVYHNGAPSVWKTQLTLSAARSSGLTTSDTVKGIVGTNFLTME